MLFFRWGVFGDAHWVIHFWWCPLSHPRSAIHQPLSLQHSPRRPAHVPLVLPFHIKLAQAPAPPASGSAACGALCLYVTFIFRESCEMKRWQEKWTLCDLAVLQLDDVHLLKECARNASTSSTTAKGPGGHGRHPVTFLHAIIYKQLYYYYSIGAIRTAKQSFTKLLMGPAPFRLVLPLCHQVI